MSYYLSCGVARPSHSVADALKQEPWSRASYPPPRGRGWQAGSRRFATRREETLARDAGRPRRLACPGFCQATVSTCREGKPPGSQRGGGEAAAQTGGFHAVAAPCGGQGALKQESWSRASYHPPCVLQGMAGRFSPLRDHPGTCGLPAHTHACPGLLPTTVSTCWEGKPPPGSQRGGGRWWARTGGFTPTGGSPRPVGHSAPLG